MTRKAEEFASEATPVIDLRKHRLASEKANQSTSNTTSEWDNEKTEVYMDFEDDEACLLGAEGEKFPITTFPFVLGRGSECDMVLSGKGLSRKHVEIVFQSGRFVVNDLGSLNGTKVNGYKVTRVILEDGDSIKLGEVVLTFVKGADDNANAVDQIPADTPQVDSSDTPFGSGGLFTKRTLLGALSAVVVTVAAIGAYVGYQPSPDVQVVKTIKPENSTQHQSKRQPTVANNRTPTVSQNEAPSRSVTPTLPSNVSVDIIDNKTLSTLPPPSLAVSPPPSIKSNVNSSAISSPVEKAPALKEVSPTKKIKPAKPTKSKNIVKVNKLLKRANGRYLEGDVDELFKAFNYFSNDTRLPKDLRSKIKAKHKHLAAVHVHYINGTKSFVKGDVDGAFNHWIKFLEQENALFNGKRSVYADQVVVKVVDEYVSRGNAASKNNEHHKAYAFWKKAVELGESVSAGIALDAINAKSRQLYRKALRLEYVDIQKAKQLWQEVVRLVPSGTEYYTKASSKLAWYERWGG